jgi:NTP pyrophosphatase (non-canonical NTP hydrolase)
MDYDPAIRARWEAAAAGHAESDEVAAAAWRDLLALMADLRGPGGCPWDREQSLASLRQYVREEADEVVAAIDAILEYEAQLREAGGIAAADPAPPDGADAARTAKKGHTIAHHPHRADFVAEQSSSGAPLPPLDAAQAARLGELYGELHGELGDLLLQAVFQGDILRAMGRGGAEQALQRLVAKLVRRHPHVYGEAEAADSAAVLANWKRIKESERHEKD